MHSRRDLLLRGSAMVGGVAVLAGLAACATKPSPSQLVSDAQAIGKGVGAIVAALGSAGVNVSASVMATLNKAIADVQANAQGISDALGQSNAPIIQTILADGGVLANILTPFFPAAPLVYSIVSAVVALAQSMLSMFGVSAALASQAASKLIPYSADEARAVLAGA